MQFCFDKKFDVIFDKGTLDSILSNPNEPMSILK